MSAHNPTPQATSHKLIYIYTIYYRGSEGEIYPPHHLFNYGSAAQHSQVGI